MLTSSVGMPREGTQASPINRLAATLALRRVCFIAAILVLLASPLAYIGNYAGDSQVHLIYGENASHGNFFEFNPGEKSAGVTSPGYMLYIASLFKVFPDAAVPLLLKGTNLLFWYGLLVVIFLIARRLLQSDAWATLATLAAGLFPGSVYNATIGMENGIFAFLVFLWILVALRSRWFSASPDRGYNIRHELTLGIILGLACWVRPEGFVVAALALTYRALGAISSRDAIIDMVTRSAVFLSPFFMLTGILAFFHFSQTGHLIPTSGISRILMSNISPDSYHFGSVFVSSRFVVRLAEYFPLALLWLFAQWLLLTGRFEFHGSKAILGFLIVMFWVAFILFSSILGSIHLARYTIFAMPALALVALMAAQWLWNYRFNRFKYAVGLRATIIALAVVLGAVFLVETDLRLALDSQASLWKSVRAPSERQAFSDELFRQLGKPQTLPVSIAMQGVQARYWLDDRFVVRSLDGRVDPMLLDYATRDSVDHLGYLRERNVRYLLDTPSYNRDTKLWSLDQLDQIPIGESRTIEGITFSRLNIERPDPNAPNDGGPGQWRWFVRTGGVDALQFFLPHLIRVDYDESG